MARCKGCIHDNVCNRDIGHGYSVCPHYISSADVVPKAKIESLTTHDIPVIPPLKLSKPQNEVENIKSEVKKEIGEEIYRIIGECHNETWVCLLIKEFADRLINGDRSNAETCIACGDIIPEGRWMCPNCEEETK